MRSGITSCSTGLSSSTPSTWIVDEPAPSTRAPIRLRKAARSAISGSRAAFSMIVVPLASTAAISTFSVAPTLGNSNSTRVPTSPSVRPSMSPCRDSKTAPISSSARRCMSIGRGPKSSPPGSATRARPKRASSGPITTMEARIRSTSS
jgi:hypothetical protein